MTMKNTHKSIAGIAKILFVILLLAGCLLPVHAGEKWVVTDNELTVWDSPDYLKKLGMVTRGYEIDAIAIEGDMIRFEYEGMTAYVATYCCRRVLEESVGQEQPVVEEGTAKQTRQALSAEKAVAATSAKVEQVADAETRGSTAVEKALNTKGTALIGIPLLVLGIVFFLFGLAGVVFTVCYAFCPKKLAAWFNERCGEDVIPAKRFNKLLLPPVYAGIGAIAANMLVFGVGGLLAGQLQETVMAWQESTQMIVCGVAVCIGVVVTQAVPFMILRHWYLKYREEHGKKAARWMTIYSIMCLVAIYLICLVIIYAVMAMLALLLILLILCVCFPARYYVVRRW